MDIIDRIDELTEVCASITCGRPLPPDCPSPDFCSEECQQDWHSSRTEPLVGYVEPFTGFDDLALEQDSTVDNDSEIPRGRSNNLIHYGIIDRAIPITNEDAAFIRRAWRARALPLEGWEPLERVESVTVEERCGERLVTVDTGGGERALRPDVWDEAVKSFLTHTTFESQSDTAPREWEHGMAQEINAAVERLRTQEDEGDTPGP